MLSVLIFSRRALVRLRRTRDLVDDVKQCAKRIVSHHQRDEASAAGASKRGCQKSDTLS
jgi:hypothetical protein